MSCLPWPRPKDPTKFPRGHLQQSPMYRIINTREKYFRQAFLAEIEGSYYLEDHSCSEYNLCHEKFSSIRSYENSRMSNVRNLDFDSEIELPKKRHTKVIPVALEA